MQFVFLFNGLEPPRSCGGVFLTRAKAEEWIEKHSLSGTLTQYPVDAGVYDWAIENKWFIPKDSKHMTPDFIGSFTSVRQEHYHYEEGKFPVYGTGIHWSGISYFIAQ